MFDVARKPRPVYEFELPEELTALDDDHVKKTFGLVKLNMDEEIAATRGAANNPGRLAFNMALAALVEVDGRRLNKAEGEEERVLNHTDPAIRGMVLEALGSLSEVSDAARKKMLASRKVKVG